MADITRAEVASLIGEEYAGQVITSANEGSVVLQAFPTVNMGTKTTHIPVLATLPTAGWVTDVDNTAIKPTSEVTWQDKTLVAEEIAVIIPVHENTLDDATEDILDDIAALAGQAIGKALDLAVIHGTNKPASWTSLDLVAAAIAAGQNYEVSNGAASEDDLYGNILKASIGLSDAGFDPMALLAKGSLRFQLANVRDTTGQALLVNDSFMGFNTYWSRNGGWEPAEALAVVADPSRVRIGVRQDVQVKLLDQATVGSINLAERDMVALRVKARFAYVLGSGATAEGSNKTPVAVVQPDATP